MYDWLLYNEMHAELSCELLRLGDSIAVLHASTMELRAAIPLPAKGLQK